MTSQNSSSGGNGDLISTLSATEKIAICAFIFCLVTACSLKMVYCCHCMKKYAKMDPPAFLDVFLFFQRIFDLLTDILVCYSIYDSNANNAYTYVYASMGFVMLPFIASVLISVYHIVFKWNDKCNKKMSANYLTHHRITDYLNNYKYFLILISTLTCDFYCAINLIQSKLFFLHIFNLQLSSSEKQSLIIWKFIGQTLCENIPQMIIQILLLSNNNGNYATGHIILIVVSLIFSVLSIISQIVLFLVELNNILVEYNSHVTQITTFNVKMPLHSANFKSQHQFIHEKIQLVLRNSFLKSHNISDYFNRSDIRLKHCVYYIDKSDLISKRKIDVYFELNVACYNDPNYLIRDTIESTLNNLRKINSQFYKQTVQGIKQSLGLQKLRIGQEFQILSRKTEDKTYKNRVLLRLSIWRGAVVSKMASINPDLANTASKDEAVAVELAVELAPKPIPNLNILTTAGKDDQDDVDDDRDPSIQIVFQRGEIGRTSTDVHNELQIEGDEGDEGDEGTKQTNYKIDKTHKATYNEDINITSGDTTKIGGEKAALTMTETTQSDGDSECEL